MTANHASALKNGFLALTIGLLAVSAASAPSTALAQSEGDDQLSGGISTDAPGISRGPIEALTRVYVGTSRTSGADAGASARWLWLNAALKEKRTGLTLAVADSYTQSIADANNETVGAFDNPVLSLSRSFKNENLWFTTISTGLAGTLPANKETEAKTFRGSLGPYVEFVKEFGSLTATQAFGYSHGFFGNEFDQENVVYRASDVAKSSTQLWYSLTEKISVGGIYQYFRASTAENKVDLHSQAALLVNYEFSKRIQGDIGYGTTASSVAPDAQADQLIYTNPLPRLVYLELGITI